MIISSSSLKQLVAGELGEPWDEMAAQPVSNSTLHRQASVCAVCQQGRKALRQALIPEPNIRPEGRRGPVPQAHGGDGLINREEGTQRAPVVPAHAAIRGGDAHMLSSPARPGGRRSLVECVDELQQLTGVLHPDILDPKPPMVPGAPHSVPSNQAVGSMGGVVPGPQEPAPPFVKLSNHSAGNGIAPIR
jgi:hypothetical protein